ALGSVQRRRTGSAVVVLLACLWVIAIGMVMSVALPAHYDLLSNSQISSRTSPGPDGPDRRPGDRPGRRGRVGPSGRRRRTPRSRDRHLSRPTPGGDRGVPGKTVGMAGAGLAGAVRVEPLRPGLRRHRGLR